MIDKETIDNLSLLARIEIDEPEKNKLMKDMESILQYVSELKNAPTGEIKPDREHINVFREDVGSHQSGVFTQKIMDNAPRSKEEYVLVKQIMEEKKK